MNSYKIPWLVKLTNLREAFTFWFQFFIKTVSVTITWKAPFHTHSEAKGRQHPPNEVDMCIKANFHRIGIKLLSLFVNFLVPNHHETLKVIKIYISISFNMRYRSLMKNYCLNIQTQSQPANTNVFKVAVLASVFAFGFEASRVPAWWCLSTSLAAPASRISHGLSQGTATLGLFGHTLWKCPCPPQILHSFLGRARLLPDSLGPAILGIATSNACFLCWSTESLGDMSWTRLTRGVCPAFLTTLVSSVGRKGTALLPSAWPLLS